MRLLKRKSNQWSSLCYGYDSDSCAWDEDSTHVAVRFSTGPDRNLRAELGVNDPAGARESWDQPRAGSTFVTAGINLLEWGTVVSNDIFTFIFGMIRPVCMLSFQI